MPEFTIVAGPNGAGKSSFSHLYAPLGVKVHDADKHKVEFNSKYADLDLSDEALENYLADRYDEFEAEELAGNRSMLVETNLRIEYLIGRALFLRTRGYVINMMFIALENAIISKERVDARVRDKGHSVDAKTIDENFEHGLINMKKNLPLFDNFMLITPNLKMVEQDFHLPTPLLTLRKGVVTLREVYDEPWANELVDELIAISKA